MYNPYTPKTKKENIVSLTEQEHREYHSVHTTTPQWQESLKLSTVICSEFQWNTPMAIYPVWFMESFIETQIAQAEKREPLKELMESIWKDMCHLELLYPNAWLWTIQDKWWWEAQCPTLIEAFTAFRKERRRHNQSCKSLWLDNSISSL